jgi:hypothetical protein
LNAPVSIRDNLDPASNVTEESFEHSAKQLSPKTSTDAGIAIETSPVALNASLSSRDNLDPVSNVNEERFEH